MRPPQIILNLREVITYTFQNPFVEKFMSDEEVDKWANMIQYQVNLDSQGFIWQLQIRTKENRQLEWDQIEKEPATKRFSVEKILYVCGELLKNHSDIVSLKIIDTEMPSHSYILEPGKEPYRIYA